MQGDSDLGDLGAPGTSRWWDLGVVEGARHPVHAAHAFPFRFRLLLTADLNRAAVLTALLVVSSARDRGGRARHGALGRAGDEAVADDSEEACPRSAAKPPAVTVGARKRAKLSCMPHTRH